MKKNLFLLLALSLVGACSSKDDEALVTPETEQEVVASLQPKKIVIENRRQSQKAEITITLEDGKPKQVAVTDISRNLGGNFTFEYEYQGGKLTKFSRIHGSSTTLFKYEYQNNLVSKITESLIRSGQPEDVQFVKEYTYNDKKQLVKIQQTDFRGNVTEQTFVWQTDNLVNNIRRDIGIEIETTFENGNVVQTKNKYLYTHYVSKITYDNKVKVDDFFESLISMNNKIPNDPSSKFEASKNNIVKIVQNSYEPSGELIANSETITENNTYEYDAQNRVIKKTNQDDVVTTYEY